ncbi:Homeodomain-like superfamily protein [Euphorbia peplus]|nr:Homeodomain-like superfamily protein [Euphorbia peplus]
MACSVGFLDLKLNLNLKLFYRPNSLINIPKDISEIDSFCAQLMSFNDHLLRYRQELSKIQPSQPQTPNSTAMFLRALETFEDEFLKLKENTRLESNERFLIAFSSANRIGYEANTKAKNNAQTQGLLDLGKEELQPQGATIIEPVVAVHKRPGKEVLEGPQTEKGAIVEPMVAVHKLTGKEVGEGSSSGSSHGGEIDVQLLVKRRANPGAIRKIYKRMTWTPRLQDKFREAVQNLGGPQVAKAKPIVELMQVKGLTNRHVRSHLQKYRKQILAVRAAVIATERIAREERYREVSERVTKCDGPQPFFLNGYKFVPFKMRPKPQLNNNNNSIIIIDDDDDDDDDDAVAVAVGKKPNVAVGKKPN